MKVAIIHYWFITRRGGEKVVESILKIFPQADIYTLFYDEKSYGEYLSKHKIFSSILNNLFLRKYYQKIFPLYPLGIKSLKLQDEYDLIISSESGPAKGIIIPNKAPHICYIHTPMRYCWGFTHEYLNSVNKYLRLPLNFFFKRLRDWDIKTINNVDLYIANSLNVAKRVESFYNRNAIVVYPPIDDRLFNKNLVLCEEKISYLSFGAITPYKRIDLLIDVFNVNEKKLIIIGEGSELFKLKKKAKNNIEFKGALEWDEIEHIFSRTRALLFPGEEDFGMIPLEVMAYGIPVIAYKKGGALETVIENIKNIKESTGIFFDSQNLESLQEALKKFESYEGLFDPKWIRNHASKFKEEIFLKRFSNEVKNFINHHNQI
jgi:glycosyltransferase involved in cell wall biosynthesis